MATPRPTTRAARAQQTKERKLAKAAKARKLRPKKKRPTTRAGRARITKQTTTQAQERMHAVEEALVAGIRHTLIRRKFADDWGIKPENVTRYIQLVYASWADMGDAFTRPQKRAAQTERLLDLIAEARSRKRFKKQRVVERDQDGNPVILTIDVEVPNPDHQAVARYTDMLHRLEGLYQDSIDVEHKGGGLVDALRQASVLMKKRQGRPGSDAE